MANMLVKGAIEDMAGPLPPPFVLRFLLNEWRRFLVHIHEHNGMGTEWVIAVRTIRLLLWSITPKSSMEEKRKLVEEIGCIVPVIGMAMDVTGTDPEDRNRFLEELSRLHLAIINGTSVSAAPDAAVKPMKLLGELSDGSDTIEISREDVRYRELLENLDRADLERIEI